MAMAILVFISVINDLIQDNIKLVQILRSSAKWFGVTYKEDKPHVIQQIQKLIKKGAYPKKLF